MHDFEYQLALVCSRCEMAYSAMGATGFLYASAKDQLKWHGLKPKRWLDTVMHVGHYMAMKKEDFGKAVKEKKSGDEMAAMLIAAFGDGKEK